MIPQHIYDAIIESPAGKLIDRLIADENLRRGGDTGTPGAHGSIIDQLYETFITAQKKHRVDRRKESNHERLAKYQSFVRTEPETVQWSVAQDPTSWDPSESGSDDK